MAWGIADAELASGQPGTVSLMTRLRNGGIEPGRQMMIRQNAAPLAWLKVSSNIDNRVPRLFSGSPSDGGALDFSVVFGRQNTDGRTIARSHLPNLILPNNIGIDGNQNGGLTRNFSLSFTNNRSSGSNPNLTNVSWSDTTLSIEGGVTLNGDGNPHDHPCDMRVRYVGFCLFQKL